MISNSEEETKTIAAGLAKQLKAGDVVCLEGDLGAGKTHFVKGMARAFGIDEKEVHSPTFTLIHEYAGSMPLYHMDCYRMERLEEALEIGAEEYFYGDGVSVIEWPRLLDPIIPENAIWIKIDSEGKSKRKIVIFKEGENPIYL